jgi:DNA-binding transcriptional regulator YdaS (Cro superfamily)
MMHLDTYLSTVETAVRLASKLGVTPGFVSQWRTGVRPVPIAHCVAIEKATQGMVTRKDLRPDDWHLIWPELSDLPPPSRDASACTE